MKIDGEIVLEVFRLPQYVSEDHPDVDVIISRQPDLTDIEKLCMEDTVSQVNVGPDHGGEEEEEGRRRRRGECGDMMSPV